MRGIRAICLLAALLSASAGTAKTEVPPVYGPEPDWPSFRKIAETGIISRLIDPESARISWLTGIRKGGFKPLLQGRIYGYVGCGTVNAKNRMGGYTGAQTFIVVIDQGRLLYSDIDQSPSGLITQTCATGMQRGMFPPVPADLSAVEPPPAASATGLSLRPMPDGAYVSAVAPGSTADKAGVRPGMVIETINAISLHNMGEAMIKVIDAVGAGASLGLVGGKIIKMGERP